MEGGMAASLDLVDGWEDTWPVLETLAGPKFFLCP